MQIILRQNECHSFLPLCHNNEQRIQMKNSLEISAFGRHAWSWKRLYDACTATNDLTPNSLAVFQRNVKHLLSKQAVNEDLLNAAKTRHPVGTDKNFSIYRVTQKSTGKGYIGISEDVENRIVCHQRAYGDNPLHREVKRCGWSDFETTELVNAKMTRTTARRVEAALILSEGTLVPAGFNQRL